ncbi:MAG: ATP-binding cassette domain-containing protein [Geminicoccaceae bacterium]
MAALTLELTEKSFPAVGGAARRRVLEAIELTLAPGERVALIGPSGCGKTTLLNILAGLDRDFAGRLVRAPEQRLAYVFQEPRLLPWRSVAANLRLVLGDGPEAEARIGQALEEVGLGEAANVFASRLSLGMARRAALARAFVTRPGLLLLDEPFVSLDEPTAQRLRLLLLALLERHRTGVLFVTHALHEAVMVADRLYVLAGAPARPIAAIPVPLTAEERRRPAAVDAFRDRLLATRADLAELLLPAAAGTAEESLP